MKLQITVLQDASTLRLAGNLDLYSVEAARGAMLDHFSIHPGLELDLGGVEACDTAGLQLLLAAGRSAVARGKSFSMIARSPAIERCGQLLGVGPESGPPPSP